MRMIVIVATVAAAVGLIAAVTAGAQGGPAELTLTAAPKGDKVIDALKKGPSVGDQVLEHGKLLSPSDQRAGSYQLSSQLVSGGARHGHELTQFSLQLDGGDVTLAGGHRTVNRFTLPIVGGTGTYEGKTGQASFGPAGHGRTQVTLNFVS